MSADRPRPRPGRGTQSRSGPCTTSFGALPTHVPGRARSVESRLVGRRHRRCQPLGLLVVVTRGHRPGAADDHRRPRRRCVLLAGRKPSIASLPASHSRSSDRDGTVSAVDRDQHALVLFHRLRGIRPGRGACVDARCRSVRGLNVGRRTSSERSVPVLDLYGRWWSRHPLLIPRGILPAQPSGHGARRAHGRRLDRPRRLARHDRALVHAGSAIIAVARRVARLDALLPRFVHIGRHRCDVPAIPYCGGLALGQVRPLQRARTGAMDRTDCAGSRMRHQADPMVRGSHVGHRHLPRSAPEGVGSNSFESAVPADCSGGVCRGEYPLSRMAPGAMVPRHAHPPDRWTCRRWPRARHARHSRSDRWREPDNARRRRSSGHGRRRRCARGMVPAAQADLALAPDNPLLLFAAQPLELPRRPVSSCFGRSTLCRRRPPGRVQGSCGVARPDCAARRSWWSPDRVLASSSRHSWPSAGHLCSCRCAASSRPKPAPS